MFENTHTNLEVLLCLMTQTKISNTNSSNTINNLRPMGNNSNTLSSLLLPMGSNSNIASRHLLLMGNSNLMLNSPMGSGSSRAMGQPCTDRGSYNMSVLDRVF